MMSDLPDTAASTVGLGADDRGPDAAVLGVSDRMPDALDVAPTSGILPRRVAPGSPAER